MRTHYRNGDEISLQHNGCDGCSPSTIGGALGLSVGMLAHEAGCPDAWRDSKGECCECGCEFRMEIRGQRMCVDCSRGMN